MKNHKLIILAEAEKEINLAYVWYENKSEGLGERFLDALEDCFRSIDINPTKPYYLPKDLQRAKTGNSKNLSFCSYV